MQMRTICGAALLLMLAVFIRSEEWPNSFGPDYSSRATTAILKPPLKLKWVARVFDNFKSGPVVAEGRVVCQGRTGNVFCLDAETGEELWRYSIKRNFIPGDFLGSYSYGSRTAPLINQGKVYVNLFWHDYPEVSGMHCLDLRSGALIWRVASGYVEGSRYSAALISDAVALVSNLNVSSSGTPIYKAGVRAWHGADGDSLWTMPLADTAASSCCQIAVGDTLFVLAGLAATAHVAALTREGTVLWRDTIQGTEITALSYFRGRLYLGGTGTNTIILNASDGVFIRSDNSPGYGVPVFSDSHYWRRTYGKSPKAYSLATGSLDLSCAYTASTTGCGSPTVANRYLYLGHGLTTGTTHSTLGHVLRAYDIQTGAVVWNFRMSSNVCTMPAVAYDKLYVTAGGNGDLIYCFENSQ